MKRTNVAALMGTAALLACAVWAQEQAKSAPETERVASEEKTENYRGVTLELPGSELAFLKKGDHVDVLVTFDAVLGDKTKEKVTATILQYVRVQEIKRTEKMEEKGAVQLLVNANEAQYLALGRHQGELTLAVRNPTDKSMKPMEMAAFRKLFGK